MGKKKHKVSANTSLNLQQRARDMATPTLTTTNFTRINTCDSTTGWSNLGGGPGVAVNADVLVQGTGSLGRRVDNGVSGFALDLGAGSTLDFSPGGANEGEHIFFWINILQPDLINGAWLRLSEDASAPNPGTSYDFEIFPANEYSGGWFRACVDPRSPAAVANGSSLQSPAQFNAVRWLGFVFDMGNVGGTALNCNIDAIDRGRGLIVTGGSTSDKITWDDIEGVSSSNTNAYGLIQKRSGVFFLMGEWQFGDATNNCYFQDTDKTIVWENRFGKDVDTPQNTVSSMAQDLNKLVLVEGTGTTDFINGIKSGTGNDATGINGCTYQVAPAIGGIRTRAYMDFGSDADITNVELFGTKFQGIASADEIDESLLFSADATNGPNHEVSGCTFDQCGLVKLGRVSAQNNLFTNSSQSSLGAPFDEMWWEDNSASSFTDITSSATVRAGAGVNMWSHGTVTTDDAAYIGVRDQFTGLFLSVTDSSWSDSVSGGAWEYWDGVAWVSLGTVTRTNLYNGAVTTNAYFAPGSQGWKGNTFSWTLPTDWRKTAVSTGDNLYFIRHRVLGSTASGTGNAGIYWGSTLNNINGAALLWNNNIDIVNSSFIGHADVDTNEKSHGIEHRDSGSITYTGLTFSGNDGDILNTIVATTTSGNYSFLFQDTDQALGNGTVNGVGQSFTGDGNILSGLAVYLKKSGTPTGNATAKLYAHSGTFGTSSVPTGAALATSEVFDVSTLTTSYERVPFQFNDGVTLTNATNYVIAVEYTGGDGTNFVQIAKDSSGTHPGNYSEDTGSWAASSVADLIFSVYSEGLLITATGGSDPVTDTTSDPLSGTKITSAINVTLTGLQANTEVRVYTTGTTDEIDGVENSGTSFTFQAQNTDFVDIVIHHIDYEYIRIENFDVPLNDVSIPIQQRFDRNYDNP